MKTINLTQGKVALVDNEDYGYLNRWKWYASKESNIYYAARHDKMSKSKRRTIRMHRIILSAPDDMQVDHINRNGLDNQKLNLRLCTRSENTRYQCLNCKNIVGFKGVHIMKNIIQKPYRAQIRLNNKSINLGCYSTPELAAQAYDKAALKYFGEFALTNKMLGLL